MKKIYEKLDFQVIYLDTKDIVCESTPLPTYGSDGNEDFGYDNWD